MKEAVRLKKGGFRAWVPQRSPDMADRLDRRAAASEVDKAKTREWEEFGEAMEKDFQLASKTFWQTARQLRKGKQGLAHTSSVEESEDLGGASPISLASF